MIAARLRPFAALAACSALLGCGASSGEDTSRSARLDPDVAPVSSGTWYRPPEAVTWQWQLSGAIDTSYDVDLYDVDLFDAPSEVITALHGAGRKVLCYFSAGSVEDWRPDVGTLPGSVMGEPLDGWAGERWLDVRKDAVLDLILGRLDLAVSRGCDGVEPDNVDGYVNDTGFSLTAEDQLAFNRFTANEAHGRGLAVALKNDVDQVPALVDYYDLALDEECHAFSECAVLAPFPDQAKPALNAEYRATSEDAAAYAGAVCPLAAAERLRTLILPLELDASFRVACP